MKHATKTVALAMGLAACEPSLPDTYQIFGAPDADAAALVEAAIDGYREAGLWSPVRSDAAGGARFSWVLNYDELSEGSMSEDDFSVWIKPSVWAEVSDSARINGLRHEIGHFCIEGHIEASVTMRAVSVTKNGAPADAIDRYARQAFVSGCGL